MYSIISETSILLGLLTLSCVILQQMTQADHKEQNIDCNKLLRYKNIDNCIFLRRPMRKANNHLSFENHPVKNQQRVFLSYESIAVKNKKVQLSFENHPMKNCPGESLSFEENPMKTNPGSFFYQSMKKIARYLNPSKSTN